MAKQADTEMVLMKAKTNLSFFKGEETLFGNQWYQNENKEGYANIAMEGELFNAPNGRVADLIERGYAEKAEK